VLVVVVLGLLALAAAVAFGVSDLLRAVAEVKLAEAERRQAEARQLWIMQYGGELLQLDGETWRVMERPSLPAPLPEPSPADAPPSDVREVPVRVAGEVVSSIPVGEPETPERERVLHLLGQAIAIAGPGARYIPSADRLGMHPQEWMRDVALLKAAPDHPPYVLSTAGRPRAGQEGRTRLIQPGLTTLSALRDAVKRGDVLPRSMPRPAPDARP
jgi:hypothetical protein